MAKNNTAAVNAAENNEKAVTEAETVVETVTIPKADFEQLVADVKLMKSQLTSESRAQTLKDSKAAEEAAELEALKKANERAEELVEIHVEEGSIKGNKNIDVAINGVQYVVQRGKTVKVPRKVAEVIENAKRQRAIAYGLQDKRAEEFERNMDAENGQA